MVSVALAWRKVCFASPESYEQPAISIFFTNVNNLEIRTFSVPLSPRIIISTQNVLKHSSRFSKSCYRTT